MEAKHMNRLRSFTFEIAWFILGNLGALTISFGIAIVASFFRGPIASWNELGGPQYVRDQTSLHIATAAAILLAGWGISLTVRRLPVPRGLAWGIGAGATVMAALEAIGF
jgi:hypothetical protein